jgi:hypothetical protein
MNDNIIYATDSLRTTVSALRTKVSRLKVTVEEFDSQLSKLDTKFDKLLTQTEIYKAKLQREMGREVRRLEAELEALRKEKGRLPIEGNQSESPLEKSIASSIAVIECILRHICEGSDDIRLMCYSFLFPSVIERIVTAEDEAYFLHELPSSAPVVIQRGREYVSYIRSLCETHVTDPEAWNLLVDPLSDWWRNDALPLIYGSRDEEWETDIPLSLNEMMVWKDEPGSRPINFSKVFDGFEIYRNLKDQVYDGTGVREFDLKMFTFDSKGEPVSIG